MPKWKKAKRDINALVSSNVVDEFSNFTLFD